jgi:hypothetical protein
MGREDSSKPSPVGLRHRSEPIGKIGSRTAEKLVFREKSVETYKIYIM